MRKLFWVVTAALAVATGVHGFEAPDFAFLLTAQAGVDASRIVISWPKKNVRSITVRRKQIGERQWSPPIAKLRGNATEFEDRDVEKGIAYEYQFSGTLKEEADEYEDDFELDPVDASPMAYGYICAGIEIPTVEHRGKVALIVDERFATELSAELETLRKDLIGDGWRVIRHDVSPEVSPQSVKALIKADYAADPKNMRTVFLLGHIPVPYSGLMNPDMHAEHLGAWPADVYYGEMDGTWTDETVTKDDCEFEENNNVPGDGKFDQSEIPGEVELEVGRVDMWDLPAFEPRTEVELLRTYLNKNHRFRHGALRARARGLIRDHFGVVQDDAPAADAWRAFPALFGANGWNEVGADEFFPTLKSESFLWAFGAGGGDRDKADGVGWTHDFAGSSPKSIFYLLHGSYFGDWNTTDNFLRAAIAGDGDGLVSIWCSLPHWFFLHLALGETVGFSTKLVQNNREGLYRNDPDFSVGQAHISMMGDPTLRVFPLAAPSNARASVGDKLRIEWDASADPVEGYHIYCAPSYDAPFVRLNAGLVKEISFEQELPPRGHYIYMVKAVGLQTTGSGTFWNLSQGSFADVRLELETPPMLLRPTLTRNGMFAIEGNGFASRGYAIESRAPDGNWRVRARGTSGVNGVVRYEEQLSGESVCEFYRVAWD